MNLNARWLIPSAVLFALVAPAPAVEVYGPYKANVLRVIDGDTVQIAAADLARTAPADQAEASWREHAGEARTECFGLRKTGRARRHRFHANIPGRASARMRVQAGVSKLSLPEPWMNPIGYVVMHMQRGSTAR